MTPAHLVFIAAVVVAGSAAAVAACWWADRHPGGAVDSALDWLGIGVPR